MRWTYRARVLREIVMKQLEKLGWFLIQFRNLDDEGNRCPSGFHWATYESGYDQGYQEGLFAAQMQTKGSTS